MEDPMSSGRSDEAFYIASRYFSHYCALYRSVESIRTNQLDWLVKKLHSFEAKADLPIERYKTKDNPFETGIPPIRTHGDLVNMCAHFPDAVESSIRGMQFFHQPHRYTTATIEKLLLCQMALFRPFEPFDAYINGTDWGVKIDIVRFVIRRNFITARTSPSAPEGEGSPQCDVNSID